LTSLRTIDPSIPCTSFTKTDVAAVKPLSISGWDMNHTSYREGSWTPNHVPVVGDIVYMSNVLIRTHMQYVSSTTRKGTTRVRLLLTATGALDKFGLESSLYRPPFAAPLSEITHEPSTWSRFLALNQARGTTPSVS
ncbi:hypothetical protein V1512DRAFT_195284, partial [Lipomyces arxii]|uniref:uncharacterized protein n=1 Tax=Lipomyces arxii TaxID=56418 RepID=UPI0034CF46EB